VMPLLRVTIGSDGLTMMTRLKLALLPGPGLPCAARTSAGSWRCLLSRLDVDEAVVDSMST
jgi:hypothetical protein